MLEKQLEKSHLCNALFFQMRLQTEELWGLTAEEQAPASAFAKSTAVAGGPASRTSDPPCVNGTAARAEAGGWKEKIYFLT